MGKVGSGGLKNPTQKREFLLSVTICLGKDANGEREVATKLCGTWDQIPSLLSQVKTC